MWWPRNEDVTGGRLCGKGSDLELSKKFCFESVKEKTL